MTDDWLRDKVVLDDDGESMPTVVVSRARCLRCGSARLRTRTSRPQGDGTVLAYVECRECFFRQKVAYE